MFVRTLLCLHVLALGSFTSWTTSSTQSYSIFTRRRPPIRRGWRSPICILILSCSGCRVIISDITLWFTGSWTIKLHHCSLFEGERSSVKCLVLTRTAVGSFSPQPLSLLAYSYFSAILCSPQASAWKRKGNGCYSGYVLQRIKLQYFNL